MKDFEHPTEPAEKIAGRKWRNHELVRKFKEGKLPILVRVDPDDIDYDNVKVRLTKADKPKTGTIVPPSDPNVARLARNRTKRRLREIFSCLYEDMHRKKLLLSMVQHGKPLTDEQKLYRLKREKLRRLQTEYLELLVAQQKRGESE